MSAAEPITAALASDYVDAISAIGRAHRALGDMMRAELKRCNFTDINHAQAMMLINVGHSDTNLADIRHATQMSGANASYSLARLREVGYVTYKSHSNDRRAVVVRLTPEGAAVRRSLFDMLGRSAAAARPAGNLSADDFAQAAKILTKLTRYWDDCVEYKL